MTTVLVFIGALALLIGLWYQNGGPERADLRGIFLAPPSPVGSGDAYGPQPPVRQPQVVSPQEY